MYMYDGPAGKPAEERIYSRNFYGTTIFPPLDWATSWLGTGNRLAEEEREARFTACRKGPTAVIFLMMWNQSNQHFAFIVCSIAWIVLGGIVLALVPSD